MINFFYASGITEDGKMPVPTKHKKITIKEKNMHQSIERLRESKKELSDSFLRLLLLGSSIITAAVQAGGRSS